MLIKQATVKLINRAINPLVPDASYSEFVRIKLKTRKFICRFFTLGTDVG